MISSFISSATPRATTTCGPTWFATRALSFCMTGNCTTPGDGCCCSGWQPRRDDYRREFWFNHPDAPPDVAELGAVGLLGSLTYLFPMLRIVVESQPAHARAQRMAG